MNDICFPFLLFTPRYSYCISLSPSLYDLSGIPGKKCGVIILAAEELSNCRVSTQTHTHPLINIPKSRQNILYFHCNIYEVAVAVCLCLCTHAATNPSTNKHGEKMLLQKSPDFPLGLYTDRLYRPMPFCSSGQKKVPF